MSLPAVIIDFDGTFDRLPLAATLAYIRELKIAGHRVLICSSRQCECSTDRGHCENHIELREATGCTVFLTSGAAKRWWLDRHGIDVKGAIWWDDDPASIQFAK